MTHNQSDDSHLDNSHLRLFTATPLARTIQCMDLPYVFGWILMIRFLWPALPRPQFIHKLPPRRPASPSAGRMPTPTRSTLLFTAGGLASFVAVLTLSAATRRSTASARVHVAPVNTADTAAAAAAAAAAAEVAAAAEAAAAPSAAASDRVFLGVMSNPTSDRLRRQLREWNAQFSSHTSGHVAVRYVFGASFHNQTAPPAEALETARRESAAHADLLYVDGRERLPHVGVVTEKSAAFWRAIAAKEPGYAFYCKSDDDTLVHLDRLHSVLAHVARREGAERPVYLGHMKWRGWDAGYRFQACGGSWGNAAKTKQDILYGGPYDVSKPNGPQYPPCPHAAGPYPYMSGGMVCMSAALAKLVAADRAFGDFLTVAKARNEHGERCKKPTVCAAQPASTHMWHHEDAGIGFNVFRAIVSANASASIVPVPGHFNDPGIIERSPSAQDAYWSSRALFVHGVKAAEHYATARRRWTLERSSEHLTLLCNLKCSAPGASGYSWDWARLPCPRPAWSEPQVGRFCDVLPAEHYHCCSWPWVVPELRQAVLATLDEAPMRRLEVPALIHSTRKRLQGASRETAECQGSCARIDVPGARHFEPVLEELRARGDVTWDPPESVDDAGRTAKKDSASGPHDADKAYGSRVVQRVTGTR